jgi:hypothetical protein
VQVKFPQIFNMQRPSKVQGSESFLGVFDLPLQLEHEFMN